MRILPTALGWMNPEISVAPERDAALVQRLAQRLGYVLIWARTDSLLPLVEQVRAADVDVVIAPTPDHLDALVLSAITTQTDVEVADPRISFPRELAAGQTAVTAPKSEGQ